MIAKLDPSDIASLNQASPATVIDHFQRISHHFSADRWLGPRNVYRSAPVAAIEARNPTSGRDRPLQLADYIAASCVLHLWDGWNYLGLAASSHISGAVGSSKHLAYYAELRAAMALLATQGIGIFNQQHCVIDSPGSVLYLSKRGTHVATHLYLDHWAQSRHAGNLVGRVLRLEQNPLAEWMQYLPGGAAWNPVGTELLEQIGIDLKRMSNDRSIRNEASYRPSGVIPSAPQNVPHDARFLMDMVTLLGPSGSSAGFATLDEFLCRRLMERAYQAMTGSARRRMPQYAVNNMLGQMVHSRRRHDELKQFLTRADMSQDPSLLVAASRKVQHQSDDLHLQMLGRATVLLRLATGAVRELLIKTDVGLGSLSFWWEDSGSRQGLWANTPSADDLIDLWKDVDDGLKDIHSHLEHDLESRHGLLSRCAASISQITGLTRFNLIGLAT